MEIAVWCELDIRDRLSSDDLATEHRWERLVLDALLGCSKFDRVYSVLPIWKSPNPMPDKFVDGVDDVKLKDLVVVCPNGWPLHLRPRGFVFNRYYDSLRDSAAFRDVAEHAVLIDPFENFSRDRGLSAIACEDFYLPRIPRIEVGSRPFANRALLWPHKAALDNMRYATADMGRIYDWVALKLGEDPGLKFHMLTAVEESSLLFLGYPPLAEFFWNHETTRKLSLYKSQVAIHLSLGWEAVLAMYAQAKLVISSQRGGSFRAGSAQEAAMYGVPFVHTEEHISWKEARYPDVHAPWNSAEFFALMDRLLVDRDFYDRVSEAEKTYARRFTYEAFTDNLIAALERRGLLTR